jgi:hypothetical protein
MLKKAEPHLINKRLPCEGRTGKQRQERNGTKDGGQTTMHGNDSAIIRNAKYWIGFESISPDNASKNDECSEL